MLAGLASTWAKFRNGLHNDGVLSSVQLDTGNHDVGIKFSTSLSPSGLPMFTSPAVGPDGTIYQIDPNGAINALAPDGSKKWSSDKVLGQKQSQIPTGSLNYDLGSSPAVAADGTIYAGSENGGIYKFKPSDGSNTQVFSEGKYQGGSVVIGPDNSLYVGDIRGTVYAVGPTGAKRYGTSIRSLCQQKDGTNQFIQSTPALDKQGNLYIGYGCLATGLIGGVAALGPDGAVLWSVAPTFPNQPTLSAGAVSGAVMLSPDEKTLYFAASKSIVGAVDVGGHAVKWQYRPVGGASLISSLALSPDGSTIYAAIRSATSVDGQPNVGGLVALNAADGSVKKDATQGR